MSRTSRPRPPIRRLALAVIALCCTGLTLSAQDNILLYGSSISDGNKHTHHDLPTVLAGGGGGSVQGGRHLRYAPETPLNNLLVTMLAKAGMPVEKLGDSTGVIPELSGV